MPRPSLIITTYDTAGNATEHDWSKPAPRPAPPPTPPPPFSVGTVCWILLPTSGAGIRVRVKSLVGGRYHARRVEFNGDEFGDVKTALRDQLYPE